MGTSREMGGGRTAVIVKVQRQNQLIDLSPQRLCQDLAKLRVCLALQFWGRSSDVKCDFARNVFALSADSGDPACCASAPAQSPAGVYREEVFGST